MDKPTSTSIDNYAQLVNTTVLCTTVLPAENVRVPDLLCWRSNFV